MKSKKTYYTYGCTADVSFGITVKAKSEDGAEEKLKKKLREAERKLNKLLRGTEYLVLGAAEVHTVEEEANT